jgi:DNA-binding winged helix-turn-helix (wHTH) protein
VGTSKVVNVIIVDPDPTLRDRWRAAFGQGGGFRIMGEGARVLDAYKDAAALEARTNVLIVNADHIDKADTRTWALLRGLVDPNVHIVVITKGEDEEALEFFLAIGVVGLHPPTAEVDVLRRLVRNASAGIVDYHPFLVERVRALLAGVGGASSVRFGGLVIDLERREVSRWGHSVHLSSLEFDVLAYLARCRGRRVSAAELLERVGYAPLGAGGTLDQVKACVRRLRQKVEPDPRHPRYLRSVRGEGYFLNEPLQNSPREESNRSLSQRSGD